MSLAFFAGREIAGARGGARASPQLAQKSSGIDILVVEDDPADTSLILRALDHHPAVNSAEASDAPDLALRQLAAGRFRPDLILLDIHMPRMDGFKFLRGMRQVRSMVRTPVVFLTTAWMARDASDADDSSAALYVIKPETYDDLEACLDRVIRRARSGFLSH